MQSPGSKNNSKKRAEKGPAQRLRQRTAILILLILVLGFGAAVLRLTYLTTIQSSELQESAVDLQLADTTVSAKRGTIYDANGNVLAESASVWQVVMSPVNFKNDKQRQAAAKGLSEIFDLEYNDVLDDTKQQSHYVVVKRRIESDEREKVLELIDTLKKDYSCSGVIQLLDDYKRYYPKNSLASSVIGFTGSDDQGLEGIEYEYDSYLSGTPGRIITAQNARGTDMPFRYEQNVESEDGNNVYLTIDETIQSICEKYMQKGVEDNNVLNKGVCIAMDVNTGAILAMVTTDGYDLNNPYELSAKDKKKIKSTAKSKQAEAESAALSNMWRNKAVADTYMPGSVFKMCVASAALEENLVNEKTSLPVRVQFRLRAKQFIVQIYQVTEHRTLLRQFQTHVTLHLFRSVRCSVQASSVNIIRDSVSAIKQESTSPVKQMTNSGLRVRWAVLTLRLHHSVRTSQSLLFK